MTPNLQSLVRELPDRQFMQSLFDDLRRDLLRREIRRDRLAGDPGVRKWIAGRFRWTPR
jgi:hypothetical protein